MITDAVGAEIKTGQVVVYNRSGDLAIGEVLRTETKDHKGHNVNRIFIANSDNVGSTSKVVNNKSILVLAQSVDEFLARNSSWMSIGRGETQLHNRGYRLKRYKEYRKEDHKTKYRGSNLQFCA